MTFLLLLGIKGLNVFKAFSLRKPFCPLIIKHGFDWLNPGFIYWTQVPRDYFKARSFYSMKCSRHFNFAVNPKYYISRHFNFAVWPKYYNLPHFSFALVLKIEYFMRVIFQHFRNFGKSMENKCKLKYILIFFYTSLIHKSIKNTRKTFSWCKNFHLQKYLSLQLDF